MKRLRKSKYDALKLAHVKQNKYKEKLLETLD